MKDAAEFNSWFDAEVLPQVQPVLPPAMPPGKTDPRLIEITERTIRICALAAYRRGIVDATDYAAMSLREVLR